MGRYPLMFGMAAHAAQFGDNPFPTIADYRIEAERGYPVRVGERTDEEPWGSSRHVGDATATGDVNGFWVEFETREANPRFYSVWKVDREGVAHLDAILMATGPYGGRR